MGRPARVSAASKTTFAHAEFEFLMSTRLADLAARIVSSDLSGPMSQVGGQFQRLWRFFAFPGFLGPASARICGNLDQAKFGRLDGVEAMDDGATRSLASEGWIPACPIKRQVLMLEPEAGRVG
jgi:hypothetical protein